MAVSKKSWAWIDAYETARKRHTIAKSKEIANKLTNKKKKRGGQSDWPRLF